MTKPKPRLQAVLEVKGGLLSVYPRGERHDRRADSERRMNMGRRRFITGWTGNVVLPGGLFSENVRTNGVLVGATGPERGIHERLASPISPRPSRIFSQHTIKS